MNEKEMTIHIRNMKSKKEVDIIVKPIDTIEYGKKIYMEKQKIERIEYITWNIDATILKNDKTFQFYEIEDDDTIVSIYKVKGGNI